MKGVFFLAEASTRNHTNSRGIKQAERIELIWRATFLLCGFYGFVWEIDGWEQVH